MQQRQRLLVEAKADKRRAQSIVQNIHLEIDRLQGRLKTGVNDSVSDGLNDRLAAQYELLEPAEKRVASANYWVVNHQHTIDRLLGNLAPRRNENTNSTTLTADLFAAADDNATIPASHANSPGFVLKFGTRRLDPRARRSHFTGYGPLNL